jgi:membrane protein implicated in regulation of membrane protease activity
VRRELGHTESNIMRTVFGVLLVAVGGASVVLAWLALSKLWGGYRDSPDWTYVAAGGFWLLLAVVSSLTARRLLRRP